LSIRLLALANAIAIMYFGCLSYFLNG